MKTKCNVCEKNIPFLCEECLLKLQIDLIKQSRNQALKDFVEKCKEHEYLDELDYVLEIIEQIAKELGAKDENSN
jgi:predicted house-cleaning noncanonical NTP pyrophosphatase (MazG superfamily)